MPKKRKFNRKPPPCPDPDKYALVRGKNGYFWRRNRGTVKPAVLNAVLKRSASLTGPSNRAAKQMMTLLAAFTQEMALGTSVTRVAGAFKKSYLQTGKMDFRFLEQLKFQENHPIYKFYTGYISAKVKESSIHLDIEVGDRFIKRHTRSATGYQLKAILLYGDPSKERGIKIETDESHTYLFGDVERATCKLSFVLPSRNRPWIVLLHIGCTMDKHGDAGPKYQALVVVKTGQGSSVADSNLI